MTAIGAAVPRARATTLLATAAILLTAILSEGSAEASNEVFNNNTPVAITDNTPASSEQSSITVPPATFDGTVTQVGVSLNMLSFNNTGELDFLLVGPTGVKMTLLSDCGTGANNAFPQFIPTGTAPNCTGAIGFGPYLPVDGDPGESLPAPAPAAPYSLDLGAFNGTDPNGNWTLYMNDDANQGQPGNLSGGWAISITDTDPVPPGPGPGTTPTTTAPPTDGFNFRKAVRKCRRKFDDNAKRRKNCIGRARKRAAVGQT